MNTEFVHSSFAGDPDLGELVDIFVDDMPGRIHALETQAEIGDWREVRRTAHQLKGSVGSYGFHAITPAAARLEEVLDEGRQEEEVLSALDELLSLCRRVRAGEPGQVS